MKSSSTERRSSVAYPRPHHHISLKKRPAGYQGHPRPNVAERSFNAGPWIVTDEATVFGSQQFKFQTPSGELRVIGGVPPPDNRGGVFLGGVGARFPAEEQSEPVVGR